MDVYVQQLTDSTDHDLFYTDATVIVSTHSNLPSCYRVNRSVFRLRIRITYTRSFRDTSMSRLFWHGSLVRCIPLHKVSSSLPYTLANEPRCRGTSSYAQIMFLYVLQTERSLFSTTSGSCTPATITSWAANISAYIKSIDSNHLVGLGDEGFFNRPGSPTYPYQYVPSPDS